MAPFQVHPHTRSAIMKAEYLNNKLIDAAIMHVMFIALCFFFPPYFVFKLLYTVLTYRSDDQNMTGKVVLITGASSGIGEYLAYEYAKKEAFLVIVARRESRLREVAEEARKLGSPDVLLQCADVSNFNDCKKFVDQTITHFGRLDYLVNNAGIGGSNHPITVDVTKFAPVMDVNFWGNIYPTYFAIPHLKKSKGNIIVNSSIAAVMPAPKGGFYCASKAALTSYYESLRVELAHEVTITIVTPGFIESEITQGKELSQKGVIEVNTRFKEDFVNAFPVMGTEPCAKAIVDGACRGDRYITEPQFYRVFFVLKFLCPELIDWFYQFLLPAEKDGRGRGDVDVTGNLKKKD